MIHHQLTCGEDSPSVVIRECDATVLDDYALKTTTHVTDGPRADASRAENVAGALYKNAARYKFHICMYVCMYVCCEFEAY